MSDDLTPEALSRQQKQAEKERPKPAQPEETAEEPENLELSDEDAQRATEFFRQEQNLPLGFVYGLFAAISGAIVWAGFTITTDLQSGFLAIGIGILVGFAVRKGGNGIDPTFGILGAMLALFGCVLGNVFMLAWFLAEDTGLSVIEVLAELDIEIIVELMRETFEVVHLLFYAFAAFFGYRYAFREPTAEDVNRALGRSM